MDNNTQHPSVKGANLVLNIVCAGLVAIGAWQIYDNRLEDGLISVIIGVALCAIPLSNGQFSNVTSPAWQKLLFTLLSIFVVVATGTVLYLVTTK